MNPAKSSNVIPYLSDVITAMRMTQPTDSSEVYEFLTWPQIVGRNVGAYSHKSLRNFLLKPNGNLVINPYHIRLRTLNASTIQPWASLMCTAMINNEPRSLGVIVNVDYLVNEKRRFKYSDIKTLDAEKTKPLQGKESLPVLDHRANLKIKPWNEKSINNEFQKIMSISPYKEKGIAFFSTIWETADFLLEAKEYKIGGGEKETYLRGIKHSMLHCRCGSDAVHETGSRHP
ncbi:hypothetical protein DICVIV_05886 [Dictyocaulus viviparus]|uniref:Uncharacterized protein n=1 Tax=Dictyocaulus viviparus TaxID=29172 RepID=A0A0D8Y0B3_DICVI|nr:hypothetical protein DICVIV_05886 [Dictyocaulus viviparus]